MNNIHIITEVKRQSFSELARAIARTEQSALDIHPNFKFLGYIKKHVPQIGAKGTYYWKHVPDITISGTYYSVITISVVLFTGPPE